MRPTTLESPFWTVEEIAQYSRASSRSVIKWIKKDGLPAYRFMGHWRVKRDHFLDWYERFLDNPPEL